MLGKRSRPSTIGKLAGALRSAGVAADATTSPRSPLDCGMQSPRGIKSYDQQGGVGLGIVVSLDKSSSNTINNNIITTSGEILAKYGIRGQFSVRSIPIPMNNSSGNRNNYYNHNNNNNNISKNYECDNNNNHKGEEDMMEEEYTYVTCHGPNKSVTTKVYYNGGEHEHEHGHGHGRTMARRINSSIGVFKISSPARLFDDSRFSSGSGSDFLSSCQLCRKTLHGKDIYMYRGEKAFCSEECRQKQIGIDERKEKCRLEASRSGNVSSSYNTRGDQIFSTGIVAV